MWTNYQADQRKLPTVASTNVHSTTSATAASARPSLSSSAAISRVLPSVNDEMTLTASTAPASATTSTSTSTTSTAQARLVAAALVSQSVRKSADFNSSGDYTNTSVTDAYPDVSRNRGSLADYSASANASGGAHSTAANKRSSFAGTPTSRSEFILSINPPLTFTMMAGPSAPNNAAMGRGGCEPMVLESNHGSLASLAAHRDSLTSSKGSLYSDDRSPSDQVIISHASIISSPNYGVLVSI